MVGESAGNCTNLCRYGGPWMMWNRPPRCSEAAGVVAKTGRSGFVAALPNVPGVARIPLEAAPGTRFAH